MLVRAAPGLLAAVVFMLSALLPVPAQAATDDQLWTNVLVQGPITGDLWLWFDGSARFADGADRLGQSLVRPGLGVRLAPGVVAVAGYAHVRTTLLSEGEGRRVLSEHRPWQQLAFPIVSGRRAQILARTRLEQRFREDADGMSLRLRQLVRANVPLGGARAPRAIAWYEGFLTLSEAGWSPEAGFDQHRGFVGLGFPVGGHAIEAGYFVQRFPQGEPDRVNRALNLTLVLTLR